MGHCLWIPNNEFHLGVPVLYMVYCSLPRDVVASSRQPTRYSLFREEIGACAAVHMRYVMDVCDRVQPIIFLPPMMGTSFVLVTLTRLIVSKPKHQVT